jgi:hypothetical protein
VRVGIIPLDSRPPNWQFPSRLADIAGVELARPPRELLGTLTRGADRAALRQWLAREAARCEALVLSWDALVYGGLVQSRSEDTLAEVAELERALETIDWAKVGGYLYLTVPRLGITVTDPESHASHEAVRRYLIDNPEHDSVNRGKSELSDSFIKRVFALRARNQANAEAAIRLAGRLGLRVCHAAVEDNAPTGPHIAEVDALGRLARVVRMEATAGTRFAFFDGADECASMLLARAIREEMEAPPVPVRISMYPRTPEPDDYTGLYESSNLEDGLHFAMRFVGIDHRATASAQWLICIGRQPQPDAFASSPEAVFNNPYLLPEGIDGDEPLFVSDLAACNAGNPRLVDRLAAIAAGRLQGYCGWNTNFNTLGTTAAWISLAMLPGANARASQRFLAERLADDVAYQGDARWRLTERIKEMGLDSFNFGRIDAALEDELLGILRTAWAAHYERWSALLGHLDTASAMQFSFPWNRAFEVEACAL